ncbi:MAG: disulfide bond formation protein B [Novosphingobium sp.]|nr:disulfide bond formation protein B [Novosphingobium sp.]
MAVADPLRAARGLALLAPGVLLGGAYVSQYGFGLYPCEMCWWQRYPHFAALALAVAAWLRPPGTALLWLAALALAATSAIGLFHAGVEYGWWQGLTACSTDLPAGGDPLEAIFATPPVRCDVAPWSLFGVSLAGGNFLFSGLAAAAIAALLARGHGKKGLSG